MAKETEYEQKISQYDRDSLLGLWQAIVAGDTPGWEAGKAFEYLVLRAFQLEGATTYWPYRVETLEQIDGFLTTDGLTCLVEVKDQLELVDIEPIAKLRHRLLRRPVTTMGIVFSRSGFTRPVLQQARFFVPQNVLLWTGMEVAYGLEHRRMRQGLLIKYQYCSQYGFPDYDIRLGDPR